MASVELTALEKNVTTFISNHSSIFPQKRIDLLDQLFNTFNNQFPEKYSDADRKMFLLFVLLKWNFEQRTITISDELLGRYFEDAFQMGTHEKSSCDTQGLIRKGYLSGERIRAIRNREINVLKRDILFLSFVKYAIRVHIDYCLSDDSDDDDFSEEARRDLLDEFQSETDKLLANCSLGQIYPASPYDNAILVALASPDPLDFFRKI